jgi:hypothetical protein
MIRYLVGAAALICATVYAFAHDSSVAKDRAKSATMRFEWRVEGPATICGEHCRTWISATGPVTDHTARDFESFARDTDVGGATLVLDSEGGSVLAALALGRTIRRLGLSTAVGRTTLLPRVEGEVRRATLTPQASCESMCAFILLAGTRRYVPPEARVLVHQIWLGSKSKRALENSYTAEELGLVQRDIGSLARYTVEMGGGIELLETALRIPPWEPMYALSGEELRRMGLNTVDYLFEPDTPTSAVSSVSAGPVTMGASSAPPRGQVSAAK